MDHPLDGARLKVSSAREHLDVLRSEVGDYLGVNGGTKPYMVRVKQKAEGAAAERLRELRPDVVSWWLIEFDIRVPPPLRLSAIAGDCVANLRSALDYVAWSLAGRYAARPLQPPPLGQDKIYFPIFSDPKRLADALRNIANYGVPSAALDEIERVQPNQREYESLADLHVLANVDKHRLPLLTVAVFDKTAIMELTATGFT